MSKLILSGDLVHFRVEMLVRILEAIKVNAELVIEGHDKGQLHFSRGKVVGASTATEQGLNALLRIVAWTSGTFSVRLSETSTRHPDLASFPDNQALFRHLQAQAGQGAYASAAVQQKRPAPEPAEPASSSSSGGRPVSNGGRTDRTTIRGGGPLGRVPELTDKGRIALRTIQTNYALRGVQADDETWRLLGKVDGTLSLYQIGEAMGILGLKLTKLVDDLQQQGYLRFSSFDPSTEHLKQTKFRLGEYLVAKGIITEVQLEAALRRQAELARKGRYMWLGEILVEMNYARPSQVQEAMAMQKRMQNG